MVTKILLIVLQSVIAAANAALPFLVASGVVSSTVSTNWTAYINAVGAGIVAIVGELASKDSALIKTNAIRGIVENLILTFPSTKGLPSKFLFYFLTIDISLKAVLALFPETSAPHAMIEALDETDQTALAAIGTSAQTLAAATKK